MKERWNGLLSAAAGLALAGCAADYVGDDWQCPLAQGSVCASVVAADPAVARARGPNIHVAETPPARDAAGRAALPYGPRTEAAAKATEELDCESECNPLCWLAGLFGEPDGGPQDAAARGRAADDGQPAKDPVSKDAAGASGPSGFAAACAAAAETSGSPPSRRDAVGASAAALHDGGRHGAVRESETIARVWIAPWVDADGIYREGAWVRAVIAPAEWRLR